METLSIRGKRRLIAFVYHITIIGFSLGLAALSAVTEVHVLTRISVFILLADLLTFRLIPIVQWIQEALISEATCTICGAEVRLENLYQCPSCGYLQVRHAFSPCPMCQKEVQWVICPECDSSIAV
jgi:hypothetical protein